MGFATAQQPVQGPVATDARRRRRASRTSSAGIAKPPGGAGRGGGEDGADARGPRASTSGPPELPLRTAPPQRHDRALDRAVAVGVLADRRPGFAEPGRRERSRARSPGSRARPRRRPRALRRSAGSAGPRRPAAAPGRSRAVVDRRRVELDPALGGDRGVVGAGDHVGVGDDDPGRDRPARALDPEPAGGAEHPHDRVAGPQHVGVGGDRASGRRPAPPARCTDGAGSTRSSAFRTGPDGGSTSLRLRRITDSWTSARSCAVPGRVQGDGAEDPGEAERDRGDQRRAAGPVGQVQDRAADHLRPQPQREALDRDRDQRPGQQRPERGAERRVGRLASPWRAPAAPSRLPAKAPAPKPTRVIAPTISPCR